MLVAVAPPIDVEIVDYKVLREIANCGGTVRLVTYDHDELLEAVVVAPSIMAEAFRSLVINPVQQWSGIVPTTCGWQTVDCPPSLSTMKVDSA